MTMPIATPKQVAYLTDLLKSRQHSLGEIDLAGLSPSQASELIGELLRCPKVGANRVLVSQPGMYQLPNGEIYRVHPSRESGKLYAKMLDPIEGGFSYVPGAIYRLSPENKMTLEEATAFGVATGFCCVCGKFLSDPASVSRGIGPVCVKTYEWA